MSKFDNIEYLITGNDRQKNAYNVLTENNILKKLEKFKPILTGTIPINIDIEDSDLDIACYWQNKDDFIEKLKTSFGDQENFKVKEMTIADDEVVLASFFVGNFEIEIFGQNRETKKQNSYKHLLIEDKILVLKGEKFRQDIIKLKKSGYKTEIAFAFLLGLEGNPFEAVLKYKID